MAIMLSWLIYAAKIGTYFDLQTGKPVQVKFRKDDTGDIIYERQIEGVFDEKRYLIMPCVNMARAFLEFDLKYDDLKSELRERNITMQCEDVPLIIEMTKSFSDFKSRWWMPIMVACSSVTNGTPLDHERFEYSKKRIAGVVFKWCQDNNIPVEVDMEMVPYE